MPYPRPLLAHARPVLVGAGRWAVAGGVTGVLWALLVPVLRARVESYEQQLAGDVTLAVITGVAGAVVALHGLWFRSGPGAALHLTGAVLGSALASAVAWGTGRLLGAPVLASAAVVAFWPMAIAFVTVVWTLAATLVSPHEEY